MPIKMSLLEKKVCTFNDKDNKIDNEKFTLVNNNKWDEWFFAVNLHLVTAFMKISPFRVSGKFNFQRDSEWMRRWAKVIVIRASLCFQMLRDWNT